MTQAAIKNNFHMTKLINIMNTYVTLASHGAPPLRDTINVKDVYGNTSMHYAPLRGNKDATNELMRNGGSILQENKRG